MKRVATKTNWKEDVSVLGGVCGLAEGARLLWLYGQTPAGQSFLLVLAVGLLGGLWLVRR
jgi:hypothetical protein